jgi:hypothetical protein
MISRPTIITSKYILITLLQKIEKNSEKEKIGNNIVSKLFGKCLLLSNFEKIVMLTVNYNDKNLVHDYFYNTSCCFAA